MPELFKIVCQKFRLFRKKFADLTDLRKNYGRLWKLCGLTGRFTEKRQKGILRDANKIEAITLNNSIIIYYNP